MPKKTKTVASYVKDTAVPTKAEAIETDPTTLGVGDVVRDKISGWTGQVSVITSTWQGYRLYGVRGAVDGEPRSHSFHLPELELLVRSNLPTVRELGAIQLGDLVEDVTSGFRGVATGFEYHQSGCVRIEVSGKNAQTGLTTILSLDEVTIRPAPVKRGATKATPQSPAQSGGRRSTEPLSRS